MLSLLEQKLVHEQHDDAQANMPHNAALSARIKHHLALIFTFIRVIFFLIITLLFALGFYHHIKGDQTAAEQAHTLASNLFTTLGLHEGSIENKTAQTQ